MKRTWTIIGVGDVPGSFTWYQSLFGQLETPPGHPERPLVNAGRYADHP